MDRADWSSLALLLAAGLFGSLAAWGYGGLRAALAFQAAFCVALALLVQLGRPSGPPEDGAEGPK